MTKKVWVTAGLTALAISGTVAKADEVTTADQASSAPVASAQAATPAVPSQSEVATAKAQVDAASQAVTQQEAVVSAQEETVKKDQSAVSSAQSQLDEAQQVAGQATPDNIAKAEDQVTTATQAVETAKSAVATAQAEEVVAKTAVDKQQATVDANQATVDAKTTDVEKAQQAVEATKANLSGTGAADAVSKQSQAQAAYTAAVAAEKQAQDDLAAAQLAETQLAKDIETKANQVFENKAAADAAKVAMESAQIAANEKASALAAAADAKAKADSAGTTKTINHFKVSSDYVNALKIHESSTPGSAAYISSEETLKAVNESNRNNNAFQDSEADKAVKISDVNNLSTEIRTDLSLYASSLINDIRTAFGTTQTSVTPDSVRVADLVADNYVADNWGWNAILNNHHDNNALQKAGEAFHEVSVGENLNTWKGLDTSSLTLNDLKKYVFESMLDFMFNKNVWEWDHARSIAGLVEDGGETYIGASLSFVDEAFNVHINNVNKNYLKPGNDFNTTKIANPYENNGSKSSTNQAAALAAYNLAKTANDQAQADLASKTATYNAAAAKLSQSQTELASLKATPSRIGTARTNLSNKQVALATARTALNQANATVASLNATVQEKRAALTAAEATLATKQAELTSATASLSDSQAQLNTLTNAYASAQAQTATKQAELTKAEQALTAAKNYLAALQQAPANLTNAQQALATATANLATSTAKLASERAKLASLKTDSDKATHHYNTLQTALDAYTKAQAEEDRRLQLVDELAQINGRGLTAVPVFDKNGRLTGYRAQERAPKADALTTGQSGQQANMSLRHLPEAGDAATTGVTIAGLLATLFGFLGFIAKRPRRY